MQGPGAPPGTGLAVFRAVDAEFFAGDQPADFLPLGEALARRLRLVLLVERRIGMEEEVRRRGADQHELLRRLADRVLGVDETAALLGVDLRMKLEMHRPGDARLRAKAPADIRYAATSDAKT